MKPLFSDKVNLQKKILLVIKRNDLSDPDISSEVEKVIFDDRGIVETFNEPSVRSAVAKILSKIKPVLKIP